jgi:hypothetical protein
MLETSLMTTHIKYNKHCIPTLSTHRSLILVSWVIYKKLICFMCSRSWHRPPLWSSGQKSGFYSRRCQILWEVVGVEWGPLSLVSTVEKLLERKSSSSGLESREYDHSDLSHWPHGTRCLQKLTLSSPTNSGGRLVGIVCSHTQATESLPGADTRSVPVHSEISVCAHPIHQRIAPHNASILHLHYHKLCNPSQYPRQNHHDHFHHQILILIILQVFPNSDIPISP